MLVVKIILVIFFSTIFAIQQVNGYQDSWLTLESMPTARASFGVAVVDGKIYAIGGTNGSYLAINEMYNPQTNTWTTKTPMPTPRKGCAIAVYQNKIYVIGGTLNESYTVYSGYTGTTEVYDPQTDTWTTKTPMPTPRADLEANVVGDKIYLIGGTKFCDLFPFNNAAFVNEVYDPANDSWTTKTMMPHNSFAYASATVGNKIYIMGGWSNLTFTNNQIYNTKTDTWSYGKSLILDTLTPGFGIITGKFAPEKIYVFESQDSEGPVNVTQIYDFKNDTWTFGTPMPTSRFGLEVAVINDELYAIGGRTRETFYATNEKYTPAGYIPEFPDWSIVPVFVVLTILAIIVYKKMKTE